MKKIYKLMGMLALAAITAACAEKLPEPENPIPDPVVGEIKNLSDEILVFSYEGGSQDVTFEATLEWTVSSNEDFVTIAPLSGKAGNASITVTVPEFDSYDDRTATLTLTCGKDVKNINLTQKQKGALVLAPATIPVAAEGGNVEVVATANSNVTAAIADDAKAWISELKGLVDYGFTFVVAANESEQPRAGQIVFTNETGQTETITIQQEGFVPEPVVGKITLLGEDSFDVSDEGDSLMVTFTATLEWTASSSDEFVTIEPTSGEAGDAVVTVIVGANEDYDPRSATVTLTCGEDTKTINLTQKQKGALLLTGSTLSVPTEGGNVAVVAKANSNVTAAVAEDAKTWISELKGLVEYNFTFVVAANESEQARTGQIVFTNETGQTETITIQQEGPAPEVTTLAISDAASLELFATYVAAGKTALEAQVTASFDASSLTWVPVQNYAGVFDGNGQTITGLTQPLFGTLSGIVKNLTLNSNITATDADDRNWGMFAKVTESGSLIEGCTAKGELTYTPSSALSADSQIGGLVGNNKGGTITSCTNEATVTMGDNGETNASQVSISGVVGRTQKNSVEEGSEAVATQGNISNCTNNGTVVCAAQLSENLYIGGVVGYQVESAEYMSGCVNNGLVKVSSTFSTGKALHLGGVIGIGKGTIESCTNGNQGTVTSEDGSTAGTYICQGGVVGRLNSSSHTYSGLTNAGDIIAYAAGAGSGSYIGGMVGRCDEGASLSNCTNTGGKIEYLGSTETCPLHIGGIVGQSKGSVTSCTNATSILFDADFKVNTSGKYLSIGGVVGRQNADVEISNNVNTAAVTYNGYATGYVALGGIVGYCEGAISGGENSGTVSFTGQANGQNVPIGGIVARTPGSKEGDRIIGVTNSGNVIINTTTQTKKELFVGGIVGHHQSANLSGTNTGKVEVTSLTCSVLSLGGIAGKTAGTVSGNNSGEIVTGESCTINGDIYMGGVVGQAGAPVASSVNSGAIISGGKTTKAQSYLQVGGVVGWSNSSAPISDCQNTGDVTNTGNSKGYIYVGGVTSESAAEISNSYNTATITNSGECAGSYTENDVKKCCDNSVGGVAGVNNKTTFTSCYNTGEVVNTGYSGGGIFVGGVAGKSKAGTFVTCYNTGAVTNEGQAYDSLVACDVAIGGVAGYLTEGANILTGTESAYNYNNGTITDSSVSTYVGIGGCVGFVNGEGSELSYLKNLSEGNVRMNNNDRVRLFVGGVVGCSYTPSITMDYASNAGEVKFTAITISTAVYVGGVLGGFHAAKDEEKEWELTFTGLTNSGQIACWNDSDKTGANLAAKSKNATGYSYIGGISGVGDNYSKDFFNCTNTGRIAIYNQLKTRLGGVLGYTNHNPDGCANYGRINYCRYNGKSNGGNGEIGGVVGYMNIETPTNLTNDANVKSTGSSPNCYTGGIVGRTNAATVGFLNCKVGSTGGEGTISGAGENAFGSTAAGLFCSDGNTSHAWDFTGCLIKEGTKCSNVTVSTDQFTDMLVGRNHATEITNAPTIVDSF